MDMQMWSLPLEWPAAAEPRATMEHQVLRVATLFAFWPAELQQDLSAEDHAGRALLARELLAHWPAGPTQPPVVAQLAARYLPEQDV